MASRSPAAMDLIRPSSDASSRVAARGRRVDSVLMVFDMSASPYVARFYRRQRKAMRRGFAIVRRYAHLG